MMRAQGQKSWQDPFLQQSSSQFERIRFYSSPGWSTFRLWSYQSSFMPMSHGPLCQSCKWNPSTRNLLNGILNEPLYTWTSTKCCHTTCTSFSEGNKIEMCGYDTRSSHFSKTILQGTVHEKKRRQKQAKNEQCQQHKWVDQQELCSNPNTCPQQTEKEPASVRFIHTSPTYRLVGHVTSE